MTIIITGAGGCDGRHITSALVAQGESVVALDTHASGIVEGARAVVGDLADAAVRAAALADGCSALIHLATVPGGAAEVDPVASRRINVDAMYDLLLEAAAAGQRPRVIYASSIAVLGDPLPAHGVDDTTPLAPKMIYGGHKAMMETAVAMMHHRGHIDGVSIRLPGILARPKGPSGMKSAFMSDLFHALKADEAFTCPVAADGTIWAESVAQCTANFLHALTMDSTQMPVTRVVTLPALCIKMGDLVAEIARQCGVSETLVSCAPDAALQAMFAANPPLATPAAERAGFRHDGNLANLVKSALSTLN